MSFITNATTTTTATTANNTLATGTCPLLFVVIVFVVVCLFVRCTCLVYCFMREVIYRRTDIRMTPATTISYILGTALPAVVAVVSYCLFSSRNGDICGLNYNLCSCNIEKLPAGPLYSSYVAYFLFIFFFVFADTYICTYIHTFAHLCICNIFMAILT